MAIQPLLIGHRGASKELPENTLESFDLALNHYKADMIEFDIQLSKDHVPMVIHDPLLDRTTNGQGPLAHLTCAELKKLNAGFHFDPEHNKSFPNRNKSVKIPTLEDILSQFPKAQFSIEIKDKNPTIVHKAMTLLSKYSKEKDSIIGSKYYNIQKEVTKNYPHMSYFCSRRLLLSLIGESLLCSNPKKSLSKAVASTPPTSLLYTFDSKAWIDFVHKKNIQSYFWTINDPEQMKRLAKYGANGIITDDLKTANSIFNRD